MTTVPVDVCDMCKKLKMPLTRKVRQYQVYRIPGAMRRPHLCAEHATYLEEILHLPAANRAFDSKVRQTPRRKRVAK